MLKLGEKNITKLYYGDKAVSKAYLGDKLVYQAGKPVFLDYVQFDGNSYIDTGYITSSNTRVVVGATFTQWNSSLANYVFGVFGDSRNFGLNVGSARNFFNVPWGASAGVNDQTKGIKPELNVKYSFDISKDGCYVNDVEYLNTSKFTATFQAQKTMFIGWANGTSAKGMIGKVTPIQIYESGVLIQDLRPCIHPTTKQVGFYDLVTNQYFFNAGTGTLKASGRFVESIIFDGNSRIDTGIIPSNNMEFEAGVMFSVVQSTNLSIIASRDGEKRYQPIGAIQNKWSVSIGGMYDSNGSPVSANVRYDLRSVVSNGDSISLYSGNTLVSSATSSGGIPTKSLYLFARNYSPIDSYVTGRLYYCKIWNDGTLIQDLRPYVDADGVACFKDVVTNTLFYNKGTGTLGYTE